MFNIFRKKTDAEKVEKVSDSKDLYGKYLSAKKDIKYLEDKYDDYVLKSLQVEFEQFKETVDRIFPSTNFNFSHWMFSEMKWDEFTLKKKEKNDDISIHVSYSFSQDNWDLKYANVRVGYNSVKLDENKFNDIIFQYFIYWKLKEIERERESKKKSFQKMVDIIGKDVKRDALIDQILS
jgi:flagellin-like hook-associated protein FlgL